MVELTSKDLENRKEELIRWFKYGGSLYLSDKGKEFNEWQEGIENFKRIMEKETKKLLRRKPKYKFLGREI